MAIWAKRNPLLPSETLGSKGFSWRYRWDLNPKSRPVRACLTADVLALRNARDEKRDAAFASLRGLDDEIDDLDTNHK